MGLLIRESEGITMKKYEYIAYNKRLKIYFPVRTIDFISEWLIAELIDKNGIAVADYEFDFDEVELMRSTGLYANKSHRGDSELDKLIFEGDYISFGGEQFEIKYSDACFWICQPDYGTELHTTIGQGDIEIIRTIWEATQ